jgi:hypothetical protein
MSASDDYDPSIHASRIEWRKAKAAKQQATQNGNGATPPPPADYAAKNGNAKNNGHIRLVAGSSVPLSPEQVCREPEADPLADADHQAIRSHVEMLHQLAKNADVDGILTFSRIDDKGNVNTERFAIGDADHMADAIIGWSCHPKLNIYMPWVIWRKDLAHGAKGAEEDIRAVLAFVGDLDADKGKKAVGLDGLPIAAPYVVETSAGSYHATFPLKRALPVAEAKPIAEALSNAIGGDAGTKDTSHIWRIPGTLNWPNQKKLDRGRPGTPQKVTVKVAWTGESLEPGTIFEAVKGFAGGGSNSNTSDGNKKKGKAGTFESLSPALQKQIAAPPYSGEDRSATAMSVFWQLWHLGWSQNAVKAVVLDHPHGFSTHYKNDNDLEKDIARCFEKFNADDERDANEATPANDLPVIKVKAGRLSSLATRGEELLIEAKVPIYQRAGVLVRPIIETVDASHGRKTKVATLKSYDTVYMRDMLGRHVSWVKASKDRDAAGGKKKTTPIDPPKDIASTILARQGDWTFPSIAGVISTPTMRPDGSLLTEQGFDEATRLLLVEPPPLPPIPDHPTKEDAVAALRLIEDLMTGFPFVDGVAKSVALSGFITPIVRGAFSVSPLHASRAPAAGSGKSFLWDVAASAAVGQLMPVTSTGASTEELEKRLGTALMKGQPLIAIDNIIGELGGAFLCQAVERPVVDVRILGRSETVRCEARGTTLYATGNNFTIVGDVCRRVITCCLDAEMEQPEFRQFDFDPVDRVLADRGKYIAAALTVCRAYIVAGRPGIAMPRLASFEGWSDTVRSALIWLGREDPVLSMESAKAEDPERLELIDMQEAWQSAMGNGSGSRVKLSAVLVKGSATVKNAVTLEPEPTYSLLHAALEEVYFRSTGRRGQQPDAKMLGNWLRRFKGRIEGGRRFCCQSNDKGGSEWWLEKVSKATPEGGSRGV